MSQRRQIAAARLSWLPVAPPAIYAAFVGLVLVLVVIAGFFPVTVSSTQPNPGLRTSQISLPGMAGATSWQQPAAPAVSAPEPIEPPLVNSLLTYPGSAETGRPAAAASADQSESASEVDLARTAIRAAVAAPTPTELQERETQPRPLFFRYEVQEGDTVTGIAERFGITANYILWNNIDIIPDADFLSVGEEIQVPSVGGILHGVRYGETLLEIAERYDASIVDIIEVNRLDREGSIFADTTILVPGGRIVTRPAAVVRPPAASTPAPSRVVAVSPQTSSEFNFIWPTRDIITSYFGPSHPLGIDIRAPVGTPIKAAADGTVIFVGGTRCCSYGLYVEVQHDGGFTTLYAHLASFAVASGDEITAGTVLGFAGLTGRTTGPHLHFEIELNGVRRNPLVYLP
ncbi:MAG: peptidoglycan DD-metalloendopeptidase family protein [Chloroflexi bacterium]|nr:peptidoglycan DD-metalloendopeptidase family protein [Chloroflexota bacterium]